MSVLASPLNSPPVSSPPASSSSRRFKSHQAEVADSPDLEEADVSAEARRLLKGKGRQRESAEASNAGVEVEVVTLDAAPDEQDLEEARSIEQVSLFSLILYSQN